VNKKLYQTVIDFINNQISSGELSIGDLIPSESQLSKLLGVSVGTVRKAIDKLEHTKVLYRQHGKGTYISDHGFDNSIFNFFSYGNQSDPALQIKKTTPVRKKIKANALIAKELEITESDDVVYLERRGFIDNQNPIIIEKSWWILSAIEGLQEPSLHIPDVLYVVIFKEFGTQINYSQEVLTAGIADEEIAKILQISQGDPVVILNRHSYAKDKGLVEYRITTGRADMFSYTSTIGSPPR
tara:strand:- start:1870 stop:2592 length:723 start_codon:yes stop_codon:yes gene_type:complete